MGFTLRSITLYAVLLIFSGTAFSQPIAEPSRHEHTHADDYLQYLPMAAHLGMGWAGLKGKHDDRQRLIITTTAFMTTTAVCGALKYSIHETRPDGTDRKSFPSGHAAKAFMGAELVRTEYGWGPGAAAYGVASGVAWLRVYNDRHWTKDVVAGAAIGILSARAAYWLLPLEQRILGIHADQNLVIIPSYQPETNTPSLSLSYTF